MRFPEAFIQQVLESNNLVDLIGETTQLKPASGGYMGRCPFPDHLEKTASFSVSEVKQVYHCFGCQKSGNLIRFMRDYHGMSFPEAIEFLATRARIPLPVVESKQSTEEERRQELRRQVYKANELAQGFFREQLRTAAEGHPAVAYLEKRGLSSEIIELFGLGYVGSSWEALAQFLKNRGVSSEVAEQAGLIRRRRGENSSGHFDLFRERVMFPIRKVSGEVLGFGGRILEKGEPKYLNSPETPVFHKGRTLYGLDQTARYIRSEDRVILVEGYMDLLALFQADFRNVAATLGTALTLDHAAVIKKMTPNITVLFDGDAAGQSAAEKSLPILLQAGLRPRGLILPENQDPDDFLKARGATSMSVALDQAPDLFNLCLYQWTLHYRGAATEKLAIIEKVHPLFEIMQDTRLREMYMRELSMKLEMRPQDLARALAETRAREAQGQRGPGMMPRNPQPEPVSPAMPAPQQNQGQEAVKFRIKNASRAERLLLSLGLKNRANFEFVRQQVSERDFASEGIGQIFLWIDESSRQSPERFDKLAGLLTELVDDPGVVFEFVKNIGGSELVAETGSESPDHSGLEFEAELLRDCVKRIRADGLKRQIDRLTQELRVQSSAENLEKLMRLQRERMTLMNQYSKESSQPGTFKPEAE